MKKAAAPKPKVEEVDYQESVKLLAAPKDLEDLSKVDSQQPETQEEPPTVDKKAMSKKSFWLFREISFGHFLFSQILILVVGLAFLGYVYYMLNPDFMQAKYAYNSPVTAVPLSLYLDINNPEDELLTFDSAVIVSGKTSANATLIISVNDSDLGFRANEFGEFSKVVSLNAGLNKLTISAFDDQGNTKSATRTVYYSEDKI